MPAGTHRGLVATLPLVGPGLWLDWAGQAGRAGDPTWPYVGGPLSRAVGQPIGLAITVLSGVLAFLVPWRLAAAWVGILVVVGAPSLHIFGLLFLLPAMLTVRREVGLLVATLVATYVFAIIWLGVAILIVAMLWHDRAAVASGLGIRPVGSAGSRGAAT